MKRLLALLAAMAASHALAYETRLQIEAPASVTYGNRSGAVYVTLTRMGGPSCSQLDGTITLRLDGAVVGTNGFAAGQPDCVSNGDWSQRRLFILPSVASFGAHVLTAEYSGSKAPIEMSPSSATHSFEILHAYTSPAGTRVGVQTAGVAGGGPWSCEGNVEATSPPSPPPGVSFPNGLVRTKQQCSAQCGFPCPGDIGQVPVQRVQLDAPGVPTTRRSVWVYSAAGGYDTPRWRQVDATFTGSAASFLVAGKPEFHPPSSNWGEIDAWFGVASVAPSPRENEDLWWGGIAENGWGATIAQSGEQLFTGIYIYREDGTPGWLTMPGGSWNASRTVFAGDLFAPRGAFTSFINYDPSAFDAGAPLGTGKITFANGGATLDYTIGTTAGRKSLQRFDFGSAVQGPYSGIWWGGPAQNGWGLDIREKGDVAFAVWYTYTGDRLSTWYATTEGKVTRYAEGGMVVEGTLFRMQGSPWIGAPYDPTRLYWTNVGKLTLALYTTEVGRMTWTINGTRGEQYIYRYLF